MAESKPGLRKPVFTKVEQLRPGTGGHTLTVKFMDSRTLDPLPYTLVDFLDLMQEGTTVILRNAKIDMFKGSMRLAVDKWGRVEVTEPADFTVKEDNNLSLIEYELERGYVQANTAPVAFPINPAAAFDWTSKQMLLILHYYVMIDVKMIERQTVLYSTKHWDQLGQEDFGLFRYEVRALR
ncbi:hypothetical protein D5086_019268 [Populus alba]|uniref:Uncharacterized protein n=1 Tax=Populus alba TaxID=43335 RepID=A0ACC4BI69_POPAL